jgi:hypothetical protein
MSTSNNITGDESVTGTSQAREEMMVSVGQLSDTMVLPVSTG